MPEALEILRIHVPEKGLSIQQSTSNDLASRPLNAGCLRCAVQVPHTILKIDTGLDDETCTLADDALDGFFFLTSTAMYDLDPDLCVDRFIFQYNARKEVGMENFHKQLSTINDKIFYFMYHPQLSYYAAKAKRCQTWLARGAADAGKVAWTFGFDYAEGLPRFSGAVYD
jgi:hypothetical protein